MATTTGGENLVVPCDDFLEFQDALRRMRMIDDRLVNKLNAAIPTESFATKDTTSKNCKQLYEQLTDAYRDRDSSIKYCIQQVSKRVGELKTKCAQSGDNEHLARQLRKEQTKLRLMQSELNVEEVVKDRSYKVFCERCRFAFRPPPLDI